MLVPAIDDFLLACLHSVLFFFGPQEISPMLRARSTVGLRRPWETPAIHAQWPFNRSKHLALSGSADGKRQDLIGAAKAHVRTKVGHPFRVIKQQFDLQKAT